MYIAEQYVTLIKIHDTYLVFICQQKIVCLFFLLFMRKISPNIKTKYVQFLHHYNKSFNALIDVKIIVPITKVDNKPKSWYCCKS